MGLNESAILLICPSTVYSLPALWNVMLPITKKRDASLLKCNIVAIEITTMINFGQMRNNRRANERRHCLANCQSNLLTFELNSYEQLPHKQFIQYLLDNLLRLKFWL